MTSDNSKVVFGGEDGNIGIWNIESLDNRETVFKEKILEGKKKIVNLVTMTPNGFYLAAVVNSKKSLILWDLKTKKNKYTLNGHSSDIVSVSATPDSSRILSLEKNNLVKVWDVMSGKEISTVKIGPAIIGKGGLLKVSFDSKYMSIYDGDLSVWSINDNKYINLKKIDKILTALAVPTSSFSAIICGDQEGNIEIYDPMDLRDKSYTLKKHEEEIDEIAITPDDTKIISISTNENLVIIWSLPKRALIRILPIDFQNSSICFLTDSEDRT